MIKDLDGVVETGYKKYKFYKPLQIRKDPFRMSEDRASFYKKATSPVETYDYDPNVIRANPKVYSFSRI